MNNINHRNLTPKILEDFHFTDTEFSNIQYENGNLTFNIKNCCILPESELNPSKTPLWISSGKICCSNVSYSERTCAPQIPETNDFGEIFTSNDGVESAERNEIDGNLITLEMEGYIKSPPIAITNWIVKCQTIDLDIHQPRIYEGDSEISLTDEIGSFSLRTKLPKELKMVYDTITEAANRLDGWFSIREDILNMKPLDGSWSIAENLEHVSLTNHYLLIIIDRHLQKAIDKSTSLDLEQSGHIRFNEIEEIRDRNKFEWKNPKHMTPTGGLPLHDVQEKLQNQFAQCCEMISRTSKGEGFLVQVNMSVNNLGKMNMYEWLYFLAQHALRHEDKISST